MLPNKHLPRDVAMITELDNFRRELDKFTADKWLTCYDKCMQSPGSAAAGISVPEQEQEGASELMPHGRATHGHLSRHFGYQISDKAGLCSNSAQLLLCCNAQGPL